MPTPEQVKEQRELGILAIASATPGKPSLTLTTPNVPSMQQTQLSP